MIGIPAHKIHMICGDELSVLCRQMYALGLQDSHDGGVEGRGGDVQQTILRESRRQRDGVCLALRSTTDGASIPSANEEGRCALTGEATDA